MEQERLAEHRMQEQLQQNKLDEKEQARVLVRQQLAQQLGNASTMVAILQALGMGPTGNPPYSDEEVERARK